MEVVKILRLDALRARVEIMSARTVGVEVAVRQISGTVGKVWRK